MLPDWPLADLFRIDFYPSPGNYSYISMEHQLNQQPEEIHPQSGKKDRSLLYLGLGLGAVVVTMGYLTLFVDDISTLFSKKEAPVVVSDDKSKLLDKSDAMTDAEIKTSLIKFIDAFYYDQRKGYFDPPSYFAGITETYYNYHNLTYQRLREIHNKRLHDLQNLDQNWIVSSLDFTRNGSRLVATYWMKVSYVKAAWGKQESADVKNEMIIDEEGKIVSLRELEVKNLTSFDVITEPDTSGGEETGYTGPEVPGAETTTKPAEVPEARYEGKLYDPGTVQVAPEFPGGQKALAKFLIQNLKYPTAAREGNIQGKVYIAFIVEKNGELSDLKVIKGIGGGCDEEALRVLKSGSAWKPGMVDGKAVRTAFTLPITFQITN